MEYIGGKNRYVDGTHDLFVKKARSLAEYCVSFGLDGISIFKNMKVSQMSSFYDGIGPEWSMSVLAGIVDHISYIFEPAAFILDVQYHAFPDRSDESFHQCNGQFLSNCIRIVKKSYGWWRPKRYRLIRSAKVLYKACEEHGMDSWKAFGNLRAK